MESDQGKLFIGGISWETTEEKLRSYFSTYGEVVEAVIMKDRATGRARGFGFIVFSDPMVADRVVLEKHNIDGRMVEAKKAVPRDDQQTASRANNGFGGNSAPSNPARTKKIFVGGLASSVTENDFKKYFGQFGTITDVVVMYDHGTHRPRGFGFITYESEESVDKVLQKTFHELNEKMVEVKRAIPKELTASSTRNSGIGLGAGAGGRGSPYTRNHAQGFSSSPIIPHAPQFDGQYVSSPSSDRALYSPYGALAHASSRLHNEVFNGTYSPGHFGGSSLHAGPSYGSAMHRGSSFGPGSGNAAGSNSLLNGYNSMLGKTLWGNGETIHDSLDDFAGFDVIRASSLNGLSVLQKWGAYQTASSVNAAYEKNSHNFEGIDSGLLFSKSAKHGGESTGNGSSYADCDINRSPVGSSMLARDIHGSLGFGDSTWRTTPADKFRWASPAFRGLGNGVYSLPQSHDRIVDDEQAVDNGYGARDRSFFTGF